MEPTPLSGSLNEPDAGVLVPFRTALVISDRIVPTPISRPVACCTVCDGWVEAYQRGAAAAEIARGAPQSRVRTILAAAGVTTRRTRTRPTGAPQRVSTAEIEDWVLRSASGEPVASTAATSPWSPSTVRRYVRDVPN